MSTGIKLLITDAGKAEIINAEQSGTAPVKLAYLALGTGQYTPTADMTALQSEFKRFDTIAGGAISENSIHFSVHDNSADTYSVYEVGVFTESGTLFAVASQSTVMMEKATSGEVMIAADFIVTDVNPESITFGETSFVLNLATTEIAGIVELATEAEAKAGTDSEKAITPATLDATIEAHDNIVHRTGTETIAGKKLFKSPLYKISSQLDRESTPSANIWDAAFVVYDKNEKTFLNLQAVQDTVGQNQVRFLVFDKSGSEQQILSLGINSEGTPYATAPTPASGDNSTKIATTAFVNTKANNYLPLAGGTMSGSINLGYQQLKGIHSLELNPPIDTANNGGFVDFHFNRSSDDYTARIIEDENGVLSVLAANGFKHNGKNIVRSINNTNADASGNVSITSVDTATKDGNGNVIADTYAIDSNTVHKTGNETIAGNKEFTGTLTNNSKYVLNNSFLMPTDSGAVMLTAGTSSAGGAYFRLYGKDHETGAGQFVLAATDGENTNALVGKPDGTLTWGGDSVLTRTFTIGEDYTYELKTANNASLGYEGVVLCLNGDMAKYAFMASDTQMIIGSSSVPAYTWTPGTSDNSKRIPTTEWVTSLLKTSGAALATFSKAQSGYYKFTNGLKICWGYVSEAGTDTTITYKTAFASATSYAVCVCPVSSTAYGFPSYIKSRTATTCVIRRNDSNTPPTLYVAVGY